MYISLKVKEADLSVTIQNGKVKEVHIIIHVRARQFEVAIS